MNRLKSVFVSTMIGFAVVVTVIAALQLVQNGFTVSWVGVLGATVPVVLYFVNLFRHTTARTTEGLSPLTAVIAVGVVIAVWGVFTAAAQAGVAVIFAVVMLVSWIVYVRWYSRFDRLYNNQLATGEKLPVVSFADSDGTAVSSTDFTGEKMLYLFYRGNWCPFCMAQIREVAAQYRELEQRGVRVVLISPQSADKTNELATRFDVPMTFLVDTDNQAARQLGISQENGIPAGMEVLGYESETVLPTVLLVGENGRILYSSQTDNYRVRPEPAEFLRVLDSVVVV